MSKSVVWVWIRHHRICKKMKEGTLVYEYICDSLLPDGPRFKGTFYYKCDVCAGTGLQRTRWFLEVSMQMRQCAWKIFKCILLLLCVQMVKCLLTTFMDPLFNRTLKTPSLKAEFALANAPPIFWGDELWLLTFCKRPLCGLGRETVQLEVCEAAHSKVWRWRFSS